MTEEFVADCLRQKADLLTETGEQIALSRHVIRSRLQRASSQVLASRQALKQNVSRIDSLVEQSLLQFNHFDRNVIPLVAAQLAEVQCLVQLQEHQSEPVASDSRTTAGIISDPAEELPDFSIDAADGEVRQIEPAYMLQARELIHKDMAEDYPVGSELEADDVQPLSICFPVCRVSKSCLSLLDLVMQILSDAEFCEDPHRQSLLQHTAKKVLELVLICIPVRLNRKLRSDLRLAALIHNNCFFAAHFLLTSPQIEDSEVDFSPLIPKWQALGESAVRQWADQNKATIVDNFQHPEVMQCLIDSHVKSSSMKPFEWAVRRSLLLLSEMKQSWAHILPRNVYNNLTAGLIAVMLDEVMRLVLMLEDITARAAEEIASVMSSLRKDLPDLLSEPHDGIPALLSNSFQFLELERILTSSLTETVSRWGSGFGPLSVAFRADQVKKLIRALFQNNELRAAALNKIREL